MARTKPQFKLEGIENVVRNMNEELSRIKGRSRKGLIHARILIHREMETTAPTIPVDTSNLRHSFFAVITGGTVTNSSPAFKGKDASKLSSWHSNAISDASGMVKSHRDPAMVFGFSANYALFVHENEEANFKRKNAGAKFMETHLNRKQAAMLEEIRKEAHIR